MESQFETLLLEISLSGILQISLNRPDKLNILSQQVLDELYQVFQQAHDDSNVKGLIITGIGKAFCAGADIHRLVNLDARQGRVFSIHGQQILRRLETLSKPSIAAVNGMAMGGGCELAMAATLRIAVESAQFAQPEVTLGIIPGYGGTQRLSRLVGKGRAMEMCLTGKMINAQQALAWGLINEVCTTADLLARSLHLLEEITQMAPLAVASTMQVIDNGYELSIEEACRLEAIHFGLNCATNDKKEGVDAFLQKRKPNFRGE
jgi:enoyl-CoA hydratase